MNTSIVTNRSNIRDSGVAMGRLPSRISALGLAGVAVLATACSGGSESANTEFGAVEDVIVSETENDDGSTETVTVTRGTPAALDFAPVAHDLALVSPAESAADDSCDDIGYPIPTAEVSRGLGDQNGHQFAWFVTDFGDRDAAWSASTAMSFCYDEVAAQLAQDLGRESGVSEVEDMQWSDLVDGTPVHFSIDTPSFDEVGPALVSAFDESGTLAVIVDLDNALDEHDAESLIAALLLDA